MGKFDLRKSLLGRWIQITGRLERLESGDEPEDYRELHVRGYTPVPLAPPQAAAAPKLEFPSDFEVKQPQPRAGYDAGIAQAEPPAPSGEKPVVTTGVVDTRVLPATASSLPEIGLLSMLMLAGAFALRQLERRRVQERR
jgi:MYXO-CTERM domain-containing protein